jgi:hypothetical protein
MDDHGKAQRDRENTLQWVASRGDIGDLGRWLNRHPVFNGEKLRENKSRAYAIEEEKRDMLRYATLYAAENRHLGNLRFLTQTYRGDLDLDHQFPEKSDNTAAMHAYNMGFTDSTLFLLRQGASCEIKNEVFICVSFLNCQTFGFQLVL